jgi:hypothetical protein
MVILNLIAEKGVQRNFKIKPNGKATEKIIPTQVPFMHKQNHIINTFYKDRISKHIIRTINQQ